jgi:hypothetical protein
MDYLAALAWDANGPFDPASVSRKTANVNKSDTAIKVKIRQHIDFQRFS